MKDNEVSIVQDSNITLCEFAKRIRVFCEDKRGVSLVLKRCGPKEFCLHFFKFAETQTTIYVCHVPPFSWTALSVGHDFIFLHYKETVKSNTCYKWPRSEI